MKKLTAKYVLCGCAVLSLLFLTPAADAQTARGKCTTGSCSSQSGGAYAYDTGGQGIPVQNVPATAAPPPKPQQPKLPTPPAPLPQKNAPAVPKPSQKAQQQGSTASSHGGFLLPSAVYDHTSFNIEAGGQAVVIPEVATQVAVSNSDVNRVVCQAGEIKDVIFSKEKGLTVKIAEKNAFLKFHIFKKDENEVFITTPSELFISCGGNIYNLIAVPKRIPSQTIALLEGKMEALRKNATLFGSLPLEKKVIALIKKTYKGEAASEFLVKKQGKQFNNIYEDVDITLQNLVTVEGDGLRLKEYTIRVKPDAKTESVYVKERDFLRADLASRAIAIAVDPLNLKKGETARAFVVEMSGEGAE